MAHTFTLDSVTSPKGTVAIVNNELVFTATGVDFDHLAQGVTENVVVTYTMSDEHGVSSTSTATITVTGVNDGPAVVAAVASTYETTTGTTTIYNSTVDLSATDVDANTIFDFSLVPGSVTITPTVGNASFDVNDISVTVFGSGEYQVIGDFEDLSDGDVITVTFDYIANDGVVDSAPATVTLTITGTNDAPVVKNITLNVIESDLTVIDTTDSDPAGENATFTSTINLTSENDLNDTYVITQDGAITPFISSGSFISATTDYVVDIDQTVINIATDGSYTIYNPTFNNLAEGETVTIEFGYVVDDGTDKGYGRVSFHVTGTNDTPVANADTIGVTEDAADQATYDDTNPDTTIVCW